MGRPGDTVGQGAHPGNRPRSANCRKSFLLHNLGCSKRTALRSKGDAIFPSRVAPAPQVEGNCLVAQVCLPQSWGLPDPLKMVAFGDPLAEDRRVAPQKRLLAPSARKSEFGSAPRRQEERPRPLAVPEGHVGTPTSRGPPTVRPKREEFPAAITTTVLVAEIVRSGCLHFPLRRFFCGA